MAKAIAPDVQAELDAAVIDALQEAGYTYENDEGVHKYDTDAFAAGVFEVVKDVRVRAKADRDSKALQRGAMFRRVFPSFVAPGSPLWDGDDEIQVMAFKQLERLTWNEAKTDRSARLQKRVMRETGLVFCRTQVPAGDGSLADAVYLTDVIGLIQSDFARPLRHGAERAAERLASNVAAVIDILPQHRKVFEREVTGGMRRAVDLAKTRLQLEAGTDDE